MSISIFISKSISRHQIQYLYIYIYIGVSLNGGTPISHPKMVVFSRKTHGCWVPPFQEPLAPQEGRLTPEDVILELGSRRVERFHWVGWKKAPPEDTWGYLRILAMKIVGEENMIFYDYDGKGMENFHESQPLQTTHIPMKSIGLTYCKSIWKWFCQKVQYKYNRLTPHLFSYSFLALLDDLNSPPLRGAKDLFAVKEFPFAWNVCAENMMALAFFGSASSTQLVLSSN